MTYESVSVAGRSGRRADLILESTRTGHVRSVVSDVLKVIGSGAAFNLQYAGISILSSGSGNPITEESVADVDYMDSALRTITAPGSVPGNKRIGNLVMPCGVCVIVGAGATGKTPLAHALASAEVDAYGVVRVGEPLAGYTTSRYNGAASLARAMVGHSDIVLDSVKDLLSGGGSAMKSGLSRDALTTLSAWSILACNLGCTIYVPVNPSTRDPEVQELLSEIARSNATMTIENVGANSWSYSARRGEGLARETGKMTLDWNKAGDPSITIGGVQSAAIKDRTAELTVVDYQVRNKAFDRAIKRVALTVDDAQPD